MNGFGFADDAWGDIEDEELLQCELGITGTSDEECVKNEIKRTSDASVEEQERKRQKSDLEVPLYAYRHGYLWVSDFCSQSWCERQMHYKFTLPTIAVEDRAITEGSNFHLARELEVQDVVQIRVTSDEDIFAIKVLNLLGAVNSFLMGVPIRREIPIFGTLFDDDIFFVGMIDEIRVDPETFNFDILELKTRSRSRSLPAKAQKVTHAIQVMIYKQLFDNLVKGKLTKDLLKHHLGLRMDYDFGTDVLKQARHSKVDCRNLGLLWDVLCERMASVPCISQLLIEYVYQEDKSTIAIDSVPYNKTWLREQFTHHVAYWRGERDSQGVDIEEAWKCHSCDFSDVCEWRQQKAEECARKNITKKHKPKVL